MSNPSPAPSGATSIGQIAWAIRFLAEFGDKTRSAEADRQLTALTAEVERLSTELETAVARLTSFVRIDNGRCSVCGGAWLYRAHGIRAARAARGIPVGVCARRGWMTDARLARLAGV